jgi:conjugal transfer pilus assembly protein TraV
MSPPLASFAIAWPAALMLTLSGCTASLPTTVPEARPTTRPDTLTALQAQQPRTPASPAVSSAAPPTAPPTTPPTTPQATAEAPTPVSAAGREADAPTLEHEPTRAEASVMRIWIAPWEDDDGTLHGANHLYVEVLPRRWQLDGALLPAAGVLQPLQVVERSQPARRP